MRRKPSIWTKRCPKGRSRLTTSSSMADRRFRVVGARRGAIMAGKRFLSSCYATARSLVRDSTALDSPDVALHGSWYPLQDLHPLHHSTCSLCTWCISSAESCWLGGALYENSVYDLPLPPATLIWHTRLT